MDIEFGIDLGTSNIQVAVMGDGSPRCVVGLGGSCPPAVAWGPSAAVHGSHAALRAQLQPDAAVTRWKWLLGRMAASRAARRVATLAGLNLAHGETGEACVIAGGAVRTPQEMAGQALRHAIDAATRAAGYPPAHCVIGVPAAFDVQQRAALVAGASGAGVALDRMVRDTTAVALATLAPATKGLVAVVDAGAGKVEVAVFDVTPDAMDLVSRRSDATVGSDDLDARVCAWLLAEMGQATGDELDEDARVGEFLRQAVASARQSAGPTAGAPLVVRTPFLEGVDGRGLDSTWDVPRARLALLAGEAVERVAALCALAQADTGLAPGSVPTVLLCGGLGRMAEVRTRVEAIWGRHGTLVPEGAVACGATLYAAALRGRIPLRMLHEEPIPDGPSHASERHPVVDHGGTERHRSRETIPPPVDNHPSSPPRMRETLPPLNGEHPSSPPRMRETLPPLNGEHPSSPPRMRETLPPLAGEQPSSPPRTPSVRPSSPPAGVADSGTSPRTTSVPPPGVYQSTIPPAAPPPRPATTLALPRAGAFKGVLTAQDLAALPLNHAATEQDLNPPSVPLVLLHFGAQKDLTGVLTFRHAGDTAPVLLYRGTPTMSPSERTRAHRAFGWNNGTYDFAPSTDVMPTGARRREPVAAFILAGLRPALRTMADHDVAIVLGARTALSPVVPPDRAQRVERLGLTETEQRMVSSQFDGTQSLLEMFDGNPLGRQTLSRMALVLDTFGALEWRQPRHAVQEDPKDVLARRLERMTGMNHFEVLGVHWSVNVDEITTEYERFRSEYGPGTAWQKSAPAACRAILERGAAAYAVLSVDATRLKYRRAAYPEIDLDLLAPLVASRARALAAKGELGEARDMQRLLREVSPADALKLRDQLEGTASTRPAAPKVPR